jgi:hypothetical protein
MFVLLYFEYVNCLTDLCSIVKSVSAFEKLTEHFYCLCLAQIRAY